MLSCCRFVVLFCLLCCVVDLSCRRLLALLFRCGDCVLTWRCVGALLVLCWCVVV